MNTEELKRLAELADAGPWEACGTLIRDMRKPDGTGGYLIADCPANIGRRMENAAYIAAANPAAILELLALLSSKDEEIARLRTDNEKLTADCVALHAELSRLQADAARWKQMAEFQYAVRVYPNELDLGQGALDEYMKGWSYDRDIAAKEGK